MTCPHNPTDADADLCAECLEEYQRDRAREMMKKYDRSNYGSRANQRGKVER